MSEESPKKDIFETDDPLPEEDVEAMLKRAQFGNRFQAATGLAIVGIAAVVLAERLRKHRPFTGLDGD